MKKTSLILLVVLVGMLPSLLPAQEGPPEITVNFTVDRAYYGYNDPPTPVNATISITNQEGDFWVDNDFLTREYHLFVHIVDPSGRSLPLRVQTDSSSDHGMHPLSFAVDPAGNAVEGLSCTLMPNSTEPVTVNLRDYYDLSIPGRYLAQVQLGLMAFNSEISPGAGVCDIRSSRWQGLVESEVVSFYVEGDTAVTVSPSAWPFTWKGASSVPEAVKATVIPPSGVDVSRLETRAIYLNNVYSGNAAAVGNALVVSFDGREVIDSLGTPLQTDKAYKVSVTGWYKGGGYFGGMAEIKILKYKFEGFFSPVENPPTVNAAKAGQTVPLKWRLTDGVGNPVSDTSSFAGLASRAVDCGSFSGDPESSVDASPAGSSGLQYLGDGVWQYNWQTLKSYAATCRVIMLSLKDGSTHTANFKFK